MGMPDTIRWTRDQVLNLPADGNRYELVDGELLVSPAPAFDHQVVLGRVYMMLAPYVDAAKLGLVLWSPADLELEPGQLNQPDVFVLPSAPATRRWEVERWRPGDDRPEVLDREMSWAPAEGAPLVIDIVALFAGLA